jgi:hypothetical protein
MAMFTGSSNPDATSSTLYPGWATTHCGAPGSGFRSLSVRNGRLVYGLHSVAGLPLLSLCRTRSS